MITKLSSNVRLESLYPYELELNVQYITWNCFILVASFLGRN